MNGGPGSLGSLGSLGSSHLPHPWHPRRAAGSSWLVIFNSACRPASCCGVTRSEKSRSATSWGHGDRPKPSQKAPRLQPTEDGAGHKVSHEGGGRVGASERLASEAVRCLSMWEVENRYSPPTKSDHGQVGLIGVVCSVLML